MAKQSSLALVLPILLVCAASLAVYSFLPQSEAVPPQGGMISLSLQGAPLVSGNTATLRAVSTCGAFDVSLDRAAFESGGPWISVPFLLDEGSHSFYAQGQSCNSTLSFTVIARECEGNETKVCENNGCPGVRECTGGTFSECALPKKLCSPGETLGCSTNGCAFGYMTCNPCGTGFSVCAAAPKDVNASCAGKPSCG